MLLQTLNSNQLKLIAVFTMISDHIGYLISLLSSSLAAQTASSILRVIGRTAFPIFVFLLTEGFFHTSNRRKYILRIGIFALLSEIPYDLLFAGTLFSRNIQNVFFTLFFSLCMMSLLEHFQHQFSKRASLMLQLFTVLFFCVLSCFLNTDYSVYGILTAAAFFLFHENRGCQCLFGFLPLFLDLTWNGLFLPYTPGLLIGFLLIYLYNGKRGKRNFGYFFYFFYPVHLLLLDLILKILY